jgi:hypothetical protein
VTGYDLDIRDHENVPAALEKVRAAMTPATADECEAWLVMLQAATARRTDSDVTTEVAYSLYAAELRRWPADVAKAACERLARGQTGRAGPNWFPTLAELVAECERLAAPRRALYASLQRWAPKPEYVPTARGIPEPSEEQKAAVRRMAAEVDAALAATADNRKAKPPPMPSIAGKPDETGITPEMRAVLNRQRGME